jgi:uncharacterized membrane protein
VGEQRREHEQRVHEQHEQERRRQRQRRYLALMGLCIGLFLVAWLVVSRFSVVAAFVLSAIAALIPPAAAIVANSQRDQ